MDLFTRLVALPDSTLHLVVVATVPVVYPHLTTSQHILTWMRRASDKVQPLFRVLKAAGMTHFIYSHFDEPELLDDLR